MSVANGARLPMPGAILTRKYRGREIEVTVLPKGFEFEGEIYRSLSAVAKAVALQDVPSEGLVPFFRGRLRSQQDQD